MTSYTKKKKLTKICIVCDSKFVAWQSQQLACSKRCKEIYYRIYNHVRHLDKDKHKSSIS